MMRNLSQNLLFWLCLAFVVAFCCQSRNEVNEVNISETNRGEIEPEVKVLFKCDTLYFHGYEDEYTKWISRKLISDVEYFGESYLDLIEKRVNLNKNMVSQMRDIFKKCKESK